MAKTKTEVEVITPIAREEIVLTKTELDAVLAARGQAVTGLAASSTDATAQQNLAEALIQAIRATQPPTKKTPFTRKQGSPFYHPDKPKLRRTMFQHGVEMNSNQLTKEEVELLNLVKPGSYCDGIVRVIKRKDRGIDIDYPIKTAAQRLKLINNFGITKLTDLLSRIIAEQTDPQKYARPEDEDDL